MSVHGFKDQTRNLTRQRAPVTLRDMIAVINPTIREWANTTERRMPERCPLIGRDGAGG